MKLLAKLWERVVSLVPSLIDFFGSRIFAPTIGGLIGLFFSLFWGGSAGLLVGAAVLLVGVVAEAVLGSGSEKLASRIRKNQQLKQEQKNDIFLRAKQAMNGNQKRYEAAVKARKSRAGRVEQFECENLGYKGDIGCYKMRRISDDSIVLVSGHPKKSIALGERVLVSQSSGQRLAMFSRE